MLEPEKEEEVEEDTEEEVVALLVEEEEGDTAPVAAGVAEFRGVEDTLLLALPDTEMTSVRVTLPEPDTEMEVVEVLEPDMDLEAEPVEEAVLEVEDDSETLRLAAALGVLEAVVETLAVVDSEVLGDTVAVAFLGATEGDMEMVSSPKEALTDLVAAGDLDTLLLTLELWLGSRLLEAAAEADLPELPLAPPPMREALGAPVAELF